MSSVEPGELGRKAGCVLADSLQLHGARRWTGAGQRSARLLVCTVSPAWEIRTRNKCRGWRCPWCIFNDSPHPVPLYLPLWRFRRGIWLVLRSAIHHLSFLFWTPLQGGFSRGFCRRPSCVRSACFHCRAMFFSCTAFRSTILGLSRTRRLCLARARA